MNKDKIIEHQNVRKKLWCDTVVAYTSAANATLKDGAVSWADHALAAFDQRFNAPKEHPHLSGDRTVPHAE